MKYLKIILLLFLLMQFSLLSADDLIKPDNEVIAPDSESLQIDLDSIKKDIRDKGKSPEIRKKKGDLQSGRSKSTLKNKPVTKSKGKKESTGTKKDKPAKTTARDKVQVSKNKKQVVKPDDKREVRKAVEDKTDTSAISTVKKTAVEGKQRDLLSDKEGGSLLKAEDKIVNNANELKKDETLTGLPDTLIINPLSTDQRGNRLYFIDYTGLAKWGKPKGLKIREDFPPVIDGMSFFTPDYSAEFTVSGYDREKNYRLIIDFVRYEGYPGPTNSIMKIWGRDVKGKMILITEINEKILTQNKIFETLIPYELSSPGRFDIIVREYSDTPGRWGIWDMIVTAKKADQLDIIRPDASEKMREIEPKIFK